MAFRIYTQVNYAETSRDPDDIHTKEIDVKDTIPEAIVVAETYIKEHFHHKDLKLHNVLREGNLLYTVCDPISWGESINIEKL